MIIAGVIAEYNPFHNGHAYHLRRTREMTGCDYVIVAMSGAFVQRGDVAVSDKWSRAACALKNGADLVVELPVRFALRPADRFAFGGVSLLAGLLCGHLSFGTETPLDVLLPAAQALDTESEALSRAIRAGLDRGETLARARGEALESVTGTANRDLFQPNNALALEYLRAIRHLETPMEPVAVARLGGYLDETLPEDGFASASAIRKAVYEGRLENAEPYLPRDSFLSLRDEDRLASPEILDSLTLCALRSASHESLEDLCDGGEGVHMRLWKAARTTDSRKAMLEGAKCKRYTYARLSRLSCQALLGLHRQENERIEYAHVLGFRRDAAPLMRYLRDNAPLPLFSDPARMRDNGDLRLDAKATDIFGLCTRDPLLRRGDRDFRTKPVIV